jgi:D-tyrosyl-tRNA(Tyr) deacylase
MRAVVQRARDASVTVGGEQVGAFTGGGLVVLVGVTHTDTPATARSCAEKISGLRIFQVGDAAEQSVSDLGLPVLLISQFTLYADTRKGRRPTWQTAAPSEVAEPLIIEVIRVLKELGLSVETGVFGADMQVRFTNDGPVTVILDIEST